MALAECLWIGVENCTESSEVLFYELATHTPRRVFIVGRENCAFKFWASFDPPRVLAKIRWPWFL